MASGLKPRSLAPMFSLPPPAHAPCDFALLLDVTGMYYLTYEIARDFLSTPRSFAALELLPGAGGGVYLNDIGSENVEQGLLVHSESPWHFELCSGQFLLEVSVAELRYLGTIYQHAGARQALLDVLQRSNIPED